MTPSQRCRCRSRTSELGEPTSLSRESAWRRGDFLSAFRRPGLRYSQPLVLAILAASTRLLAPNLLMASER